jgi:hypothetical protein
VTSDFGLLIDRSKVEMKPVLGRLWLGQVVLTKK